MDYKVELDIYRGPLDLLLYLVKRNEVDIRDIPIALITEQYLAYLEVLKEVDVEQAAEFLVMAGTLIEIKSRSLLPRSDENTDEEDDPRHSLVQQLLEYKRFKELAEALERRAESQGLRMPRSAPVWPTESQTEFQPVGPVEVWDLVSAFSRLIRETLAEEQAEVFVDETPIQVWIDELLSHLAAKGRARFDELFVPPRTRRRLLGLFLALLDLMKSGRVSAEQEVPFGDIWVELLPEVQPTFAAEPAATPSEQLPLPSAG
ncbi:MAG: segregation/condensation protein A [Gemmatales bacterium]|nr:segregation/condensation protein A [Gemmatales bacterium]MDW8388099.1 segregation/condensation protein A [Gemmatales bacterium]